MTTLEDTIKWIATLERRLLVLETMETGGYLFPLGPYNGATSNIAATGITHGGTIAKDLTVVEVYLACLVVTTNDATNYWSFEFKRLDTSATIFTLDTKGLTAGTWGRVISVGRSDGFVGTMRGILINAVKNGAPGNLSMFNPAMIVL